MNSLVIIVILFLVAIFTNRMLALPQQLKLNKQLIALKKTGSVSSVGLAKSWHGSAAAVLICDKDGNIESAYKVGGKLITAKFVKDENFAYKNYRQIIDDLKNIKKISTQQEAYLMAAEFLDEGLINS